MPFARIRVGQFKVPFSLSSLVSSSQLDLINRPLAVDNLVNQYDIGLMLFGGFWRERIEYAAGAFNGQSRNQPETDNGKDFTGRIVLAPFRHSGRRLVENTFLGASGASGRRSGTLHGEYKTGSGVSFFSFADSTVKNSSLQRFGADLQWLVGRSAVKAEYVQLRYGTTAGSVTNSGYSVDFTYFLTGEEQVRNSVVKPKNSLNPAQGTWGALEFAARIQTLNLSTPLPRVTDPSQAKEVNGISTGLNWYPNDDVKIAVNYEWLGFGKSMLGHDAAYSSANLLAVRFQYQF